MGEHLRTGIAVLVGRQDSKASCVSFGLPPPNMSQLSSRQWLLLFNFPRPSRSRSGCSLSARRARSQRLCPSSGLHVHFKASPLSSHCSSRPGGCYLFTDGTCSPGMPPLHPSQLRTSRHLPTTLGGRTPKSPDSPSTRQPQALRRTPRPSY